MKRPKKRIEVATQAMKRLEGASRSNHKCKICRHLLRGEIDQMIAAGIRYDSIVEFASERGLQLSSSGLSRHRANHLMMSESEALKELENADTAVNKVLTRLVCELGRRSLKDLSTKQIAAYIQASLEVSLALRAQSPVQASG